MSGQESWGLRGGWDWWTCYALMSYPWTLLQCEHTAPPTIISNTSNFYPYQHTHPTPLFHVKLTKVGPQCLVLMCVCVWGGSGLH